MSLGDELGISDSGEGEAYAAMDWLLKRQQVIEQQLGGKHLTDGCLVLCDVSVSYDTGRHCNLARFGHRKDRKLGVPEIVYGLIGDYRGCPVAIQVFEGNTSEPKVFSEQMAQVKERFGLKRLIIAGDRGLITCRNPLLAKERARKRIELPDATEMLLQEVVDATKRQKRACKQLPDVAKISVEPVPQYH